MDILFCTTGDEWLRYSDFIQNIILKYKKNKICDAGGGANPVIPEDFITKYQLDYTILDISKEQLALSPPSYKKILKDIEDVDLNLEETYDLVITKMLLEHILDAKQLHKNIYKILNPGGMAVHYFPTLYSLPFIINKIMPGWLSKFLLNIFAPRNLKQYGKFPAYYNWCYGPIPKMLGMLRESGFEVLEYRAFFGHIYYEKIPFLDSIHKKYSEWLTKNPNPYFTSFAQVILRKMELSS